LFGFSLSLLLSLSHVSRLVLRCCEVICLFVCLLPQMQGDARVVVEIGG
jgi:hypothetical protein